jgi:hypothetical protein
VAAVILAGTVVARIRSQPSVAIDAAIITTASVAAVAGLAL